MCTFMDGLLNHTNTQVKGVSLSLDNRIIIPFIKDITELKIQEAVSESLTSHPGSSLSACAWAHEGLHAPSWARCHHTPRLQEGQEICVTQRED